MRVISGKYKGRPLVPFQADHIRPTTDRVKETLFNMWMFDVAGAQVADLFSGTGNLGIEALSRGAKHVVFVEKHPKSIEILRQNLTKLKVPAADYTIVNADVLQYLRKYEGEPFGLIFVDPPFTERMADKVLAQVSVSRVFGAETLLAIESERTEKVEENYADIERYDQRKFGDKILSFFAKKRDNEGHD